MARLLTRSAPAPLLCPQLALSRAHDDRRSASRARSLFMAALLVILLATIGLAVRAATYRGQWSAADSETTEVGLVDTFARTFVLVLLSLLGLLALGMMYGNVLGSANAGP
jgi:thiol:disulfide interchange protein